MKKRLILLYGILFVSALSVFGQEGTGPVNTQPDDRKRIAELLKHPTFIQLRLLSMPRDVSREKSTDTPAPYRVKDWIAFRLLISQNLLDGISVAKFRSPYSEVRPVLLREGDVVPYSKQAEAAIEKFELLVGSADHLTLKPGTEYNLQEIRMDDWYEPLPPGPYRLVNRQRFEIDGPWTAESSALLFEVVPSKKN